jgi:hypothetical protein
MEMSVLNAGKGISSVQPYFVLLKKETKLTTTIS